MFVSLLIVSWLAQFKASCKPLNVQSEHRVTSHLQGFLYLSCLGDAPACPIKTYWVLQFRLVWKRMIEP